MIGADILCGMRNGQIIEIKGGNTIVLMDSHCDGEVWGISLVPDNPNLIASVADDNTLRI